MSDLKGDGTVPTGVAISVDQTLPATGTTPVPSAIPRKGDYRELVGVDPLHYEVGAELARGGMGRILAARDRRLGRPVAIKELLDRSSDLRARFEREARITAKLQHPSIVNLLEAGAWPNGDPFFAMKLVTGDSLDKVIATRATAEARLALLPTMIAVVDALAYAHGQGVIHRDLKPSNVLVGEFGETVVIDWGLAKDLAAGDGEVSLGAPRAASSAADATIVGAILGTPGYMPPEQAAGASVDARADVYALGAMLYHVLAGAPPYAGDSQQAILAAVTRAGPRPLAERAPDVSPDLVTIVEKAMARAPEERYPSARELVDDLKKFQTGQLVGAHRYSLRELLARWLRRHRTAVGVAVVAAVVVAALGVIGISRIVREQERTETQRRVAVENRDEAEELLRFMLFDLRDKLQPLGRLELLEVVAKKAMAYYERRGDAGDDADQRRRATALENLGDVLFSEGHDVEALAEYRAALAIGDRLVARHPSDPEDRHLVATCRGLIGHVLDTEGDHVGSLAAYREQLAIDLALVATSPTAKSLHDAAGSHASVGSELMVRGDSRGALAEYQAELTAASQAAGLEPEQPEWQRDIAVSHERIADTLMATGEWNGALTELRSDRAIRSQLAAHDPTNAEWQRAVEVSDNKLGFVLAHEGDANGALAEHRAALAIAARLAAQDPMNWIWQRDLAIAHNDVGDVLVARDLDGALVEYDAGRDVLERLAAQHPTNADLQRDLSIAHHHTGRVLAAKHDPAGALAAYRAELAVREGLSARDPANALWQHDVAAAHDDVGDRLVELHDPMGALADYRAGLAIRAQLAARDPANAGWERELAVSHSIIADVLLKQADPRAVQEGRLALDVMEHLASKDPSNDDRRGDVADAHQDLGDALAAAGDHDAAHAEYASGLAIATALAQAKPSDAERQERVQRLTARASRSSAKSR